MKYCYVDTACGRVKGIEEEKVLAFHSIPYAITERFEDPKAVEPWEEYDATRKQSNCYQRFAYVDESVEDNNFYYREFDYMRDSDWVESPMTLSIRTPKKAEKCPVVIYFHGGSFDNGCIDDEPFGSTTEYADRGIIFISAGYRLNVFGLYGSNNYGLKDQAFAINWVRDNIAAFGGNPDHIVLMGQSAGAMCVSDLLLDKRLEGTVKAAVLMSGAGLIPKFAGPAPREQNAQFWQAVREKAGCQNDEELKKVDPQILWQAWYDCKATVASIQNGVPAIDGEVVTDYPRAIAKRNEDLNIPLLVGVTSQDMFPFMIFDLAYNVSMSHVRRKRKPVWGYYFDVALPGDSYKAFHGSDLWYMFGGMEKSWRPFDDQDRSISKTMIDYTCNFIKNYDPNGEGLVKWSPISRLNRRFRLFSRRKNTTITPAVARGKLFHSFLFDKGPF